MTFPILEPALSDAVEQAMAANERLDGRQAMPRPPYIRFDHLKSLGLFNNRATLSHTIHRETDPFPRPFRLGGGRALWSLPDVVDWISRCASVDDGSLKQRARELQKKALGTRRENRMKKTTQKPKKPPTPTLDAVAQRVFKTGVGLMIPAGLRGKSGRSEHKILFTGGAEASSFTGYLEEHGIRHRIDFTTDGVAILIPRDALR